MKKLITLFLLSLVMMAGACNKAPQGSSEEKAIRESLEKYLTTKKSINLQALKVEYKNFQVAQNQATVDVLFKGGSSNDMTIGYKYSLKKTADGWEVEKGEATSGSMFGGHAGAPASAETPLPPGHPNVTPPAGSGTPAPPPPGPMEPAHSKDAPRK
ncbi:MAG: hypothetical protein LAO31_16135 [Acidobacteriia bacterium]|nr:hypothetical protein [Terriglobia bacterium]